MRAQRNTLIVLVLSAMLVVGLAATAAQAQGGKPEVKSAEAFGIIWDHGNGNANGRNKPPRGTSPNLSYHGGAVRTDATAVFPIFWGSSWPSYTGDEIDGINAFYQGVSNSSYLKTNTEYTASSNGTGPHVSASISATAAVTDPSVAPARAPSTTDVLNEVVSVYGNSLTQDGYYPVYSDQPRGNAGYCAWHSTGTVGSTRVQFAFFFKLDGDPGCDPQSPASQSEGLSALGNVSGHELSEMLTDPQLNAWFDGQGSENADKCAWTFSGKLQTYGAYSFKIQGNWSNSAYDAGLGYVRGCIDSA